MAKIDVKVVSDNMDKYATYTNCMDKYNSALENDAYLEAMMLVYAMLEDRLKSFLVYIKAIDNIESRYLDIDDTKELLMDIYLKYYKGKKKNVLDLNNISCKKNLVLSIFEWYQEHKYIKDNDEYLDKLKSLMDLYSYDESIEMFKDFDTWCNFRNNVMHGLLNKNSDSVNCHLKEQAEYGLKIFRYFDKLVSKARNSKIIF